MDTKLRQHLDKDLIEQFKCYAKSNNACLTKSVENYLDELAKISDKKSQISPLVESLAGVIPSGNYDDREDYKEYLFGKYS